MNIKQLIPIELGWNACFLIRWNATTKDGTYGVLPIVCLGLIKTSLHVDDESVIRPFVARTNGAIVCVDEIDYKLICLVAPGESALKIVATINAVYANGDWDKAHDLT